SMVDEFQLTMACELVAAVRAIRMRGNTTIVADAAIGDVLARALATLPAGLEDRSLTQDVDDARDLIEQWYADQSG
ncbi:MAG: aromatic amino acid lyase, partial [Nocardioidaceae bacterium]|nr:aromatic amino acid lyase [Nocardioidaceae bacterium]